MGVSWTVRSLRAAVFAVVCVLLAAGGTHWPPAPCHRHGWRRPVSFRCSP